jgi:hypothetical protein
MRRPLIAIVRTALIGAATLLTGCLVFNQSPLTTINTVPPQVVGTVPSLDGGSACLPLSALDGGIQASLPAGVPAQVIFSEPMDDDTLEPGLALYACNPTCGGAELPLALTVIPGSPLPPYAQSNPAPYTVQLGPAANGEACQPDGGTYGCFLSGVYLLDVRTLLTDAEGNALPAECEIQFQAL